MAEVLAQTEADAARLRALGVPVLGNLKFDATPDAAQRQRDRAWRAALGQPVLLLASSGEGEKAQWLQVLKQKMHFAQIRPAQIAIK